MEKIGLFGGTFNPIHFGHLNLALELREKGGLDRVWFIPALVSPFRVDEAIISYPHRFKMVEIALSDFPGFEVSTIELSRPPPSFMIDTIREILSTYSEKNFFLLLGEDSLLRFNEWKEPLEIVRKMPLLIGSRHPSTLLKQLPHLNFDREIVAAIKQGMTVIRQLEISATEIRERLKNGLNCIPFLPSKVLDYIYENQLYFKSRTYPNNPRG
jgi:nicotinate-nucleotide adenylyltransferase